MMTTWHGYVVRITGPLWEESTCYLWIPHEKATNVEIKFFLIVRLSNMLNGRIVGDLKHHDVYVTSP